MVSSNSPAAHPGPAPRRFELLTLGDELLLGLTANGHLTFIGEQLGRRGVQLTRNVTLSDEAAVIAAEFRASWARADVIITTGGLGPTCDDRTREALAVELGQELVHDPAIEQAIAARFAAIGRPMTPNNLKQAIRFARCDVLPNAHGTAPGLWVEQDGKVLIMLPGPPNELQPMFTEQVIPRLAQRGLLLSREAYVQIRTAGIGESALETKLHPLLAPFGDALNIAWCAHPGSVDCRLSSPDGRLDLEQLEKLADQCAAVLGEDFVCHGHNSLARVCADLLRGREKKIAVAEAATGGLLASALTEVCGACKFFAGGVVCCSNDAKIQLLGVPECLLKQHGAVSAEAAVALATGAAETFGSEYGLAITGTSGTAGSTAPWGGSTENPVGTMYLALHAPRGVWSKKISLPGSRRTTHQRAVNIALDWLRRELVRAPVGVRTPAQAGG